MVCQATPDLHSLLDNLLNVKPLSEEEKRDLVSTHATDSINNVVKDNQIINGGGHAAIGGW